MVLSMKMRARIPQPFRAWLFKIYPGRWTQAEIDAQRARAHEMYLAMQKLIEPETDR